MKRLLYVILSLLCFVSCSKDEDNESDNTITLTEEQRAVKADSLYSILCRELEYVNGTVIDEKVGCFRIFSQTNDNGSKSTSDYYVSVLSNDYGITQHDTYSKMNSYFVMPSVYTDRIKAVVAETIGAVTIYF